MADAQVLVYHPHAMASYLEDSCRMLSAAATLDLGFGAADMRQQFVLAEVAAS